MKFLFVNTIRFNHNTNKYDRAGKVLLNLSHVSQITHYSWTDSLGQKNEYHEIWFSNLNYQDTIKITVGEFEDIKEEFFNEHQSENS